MKENSKKNQRFAKGFEPVSHYPISYMRSYSPFFSLARCCSLPLNLNIMKTEEKE